MSKWEERVDKIIKEEKEKHVAVYELMKQLQKYMHGFTPVDKNLLFREIKKICDETILYQSEVRSITVEPKYKNENDEAQQIFTFNLEGDFNGSIIIETGKGWRDTKDGRINIFYVSSYDCKVNSNKEQRTKKAFEPYKHMVVEKLVDIALDNKLYITYEDTYKNYEIWHKRPSEYGDSIKGRLSSYNRIDSGKENKKRLTSLNKLSKYDDIREYAENKLDGVSESQTYEWTEYRL
ncbi:hypothetical protein [Lederbergia lenta]|uniref:hypothetical protein n=1 Tax=Lederbergia lenta TaxID=1467 RepID=UPI002041ED33|nr:hypothetical protein [Lederbergia lenta]MCM3109924.1 hypothetical protein [Lederbergia lenta]